MHHFSYILNVWNPGPNVNIDHAIVTQTLTQNQSYSLSKGAKSMPVARYGFGQPSFDMKQESTYEFMQSLFQEYSKELSSLLVGASEGSIYN